jgi:hypothetical protein
MEGARLLNYGAASGLAWDLIVWLLYRFGSAGFISLESKAPISQIILQLF